MAQLANKPVPGDWSFIGSYENAFDRHRKQFAKLEDEAANVNPDVSLVGALVRFPWADGYAIYRVSKDKPLTLQHVPYSDAWQVPYSQIRGLRRADVIEMVKREQALQVVTRKRC